MRRRRSPLDLQALSWVVASFSYSAQMPLPYSRAITRRCDGLIDSTTERHGLTPSDTLELQQQAS